MELGYEFHWKPYSTPVLTTPSGRRVNLRVDNDVPVVDAEMYTVTNADIAYFLLDVCNAAWPGEEKLNNEEPECFQDAWNHSNPVQRKKWRAAIRK